MKAWTLKRRAAQSVLVASHWTPERRAAHGAAVKAAWQRGPRTKDEAASLTPATSKELSDDDTQIPQTD